MSKHFFVATCAAGLAAVGWIAFGFIGSSWLALAVTTVIAAVYLLGAGELRQFRAATAALRTALDDLTQAPASLGAWLERIPAGMRQAVRLRVEGERGALPGPPLTPYLVGLLVMLGMLGTFLGMVMTFNGAVFALERSADLQAMRSALAEPIKGLGLSFGTSVAGVAASAMLGLMAAISRRERMEVARLLDQRVATVLQPFSLVHQRQETFKAVQAQARALPDIAGKLDALIERLEQRTRQLDEGLLQRQAEFQREAGRAYAELARSVGASLQDSLTASARAAGDTIVPVVEGAMAQVARDAQRMHARLGEVARERTATLEQLGTLLRTIDQASTQHAAKAAEMAAQTSATAAELSGAAHAFGSGVQAFQAGTERMVQTLQRIESSLERSTTRSDEQLAYYVAQAREVIDLSIASQEGVIENLRQLQGKAVKPVALAAGGR